MAAPLAQACSTRSLKRLLNDLTSLYVSNRTRVSRGIYLALFLIVANRIRNTIKEQKAAAARAAEARRRGGSAVGKGSEAKGRKKVELDREFFRSLGKLLRICVPGWKSAEMRLLGSYSVFLVLRTLISLYVAELDGRLVSSLVKGKGKAFAKGLVWWMIVAVPATFTNSMVSFVLFLWSRQIGKSVCVEAFANRGSCNSCHGIRRLSPCDIARGLRTIYTIAICTR